MTHTAITVFVFLLAVSCCRLASVVLPQVASNSSSLQVNATKPNNLSTVISVTHTGREHVLEPTKLTNVSQNISKPIFEEPPRHNHIKPSVPKKGVSQPSDTVIAPPTSSSSYKSTPVHSKPLITEADTDYIEANNNKESSEAITLNNIQYGWSGSKINRAKYVTPIVAVIMSVPFVAVVISLIYKRSADWWQHRNYKRMDFLVDGMYQN